MKKSVKLLMTMIVGVLPLLSNAQEHKVSNSPQELKTTMNKIFTRNIAHDILNDSVALYTFMFKVQIVTTKDAKIKVMKLSVNDSLAYKLFPDYKQLHSADYHAFLINRNQVNLIIPILIYNDSSGKRKYSKQGERSLVDMESTINLFDRSLTSIIPSDKIWLEDVFFLNLTLFRYSVKFSDHTAAYGGNINLGFQQVSARRSKSQNRKRDILTS